MPSPVFLREDAKSEWLQLSYRKSRAEYEKYTEAFREVEIEIRHNYMLLSVEDRDRMLRAAYQRLRGLSAVMSQEWPEHCWHHPTYEAKRAIERACDLSWEDSVRVFRARKIAL